MFRAIALLSLATMFAGCAADPQNRPAHLRVGAFCLDWAACICKALPPYEQTREIDPSKEPDGYIGNLKTGSRYPSPGEVVRRPEWRPTVQPTPSSSQPISN